MLELRKMRDAEYPGYCEYFIDDYSREIVENYGHSIDTAIDMARQSLEQSFPDGLETSAHDLLCIEVESDGQEKPQVIGYLWHSIQLDDNSTFIYDFYIDDQYRSRGYGKQAIEQLEVMSIAMGIKQIKLRVAYQNHRALALYQSVGFVITGYNMSKVLSAS